MLGSVKKKASIVIPFILDRLGRHRAKHNTPFFIGFNGMQGVGKTTLVKALQKTLSSPPHSHPTLTISIDDFYYSHQLQGNVAHRHPANKLVQHRGQPSTHDVSLMENTFRDLKARKSNTRIPMYDKSAYKGEGDTAPEDTWPLVNKPGEASIDVVIFEGWCVGFRALGPSVLEQLWRSAVEDESAREQRGGAPHGRLGFHTLEDVSLIDECLDSYDRTTDQLDAFVFMDAQDTHFVYDWRLEQERKLREEKGSGMSDDRVKEFVDGYYTSYELYTENLRKGVFRSTGEGGTEEKGRQLRMVVGMDRNVVYHEVT